MDEDFDIKDSGSFFDFKGFLFKVLSFWPLFIICLVIAYSIAYYINVRKQPIYSLSTKISIKDDQISIENACRKGSVLSAILY